MSSYIEHMLPHPSSSIQTLGRAGPWLLFRVPTMRVLTHNIQADLPRSRLWYQQSSFRPENGTGTIFESAEQTCNASTLSALSKGRQVPARTPFMQPLVSAAVRAAAKLVPLPLVKAVRCSGSSLLWQFVSGQFDVNQTAISPPGSRSPSQ
jgi:hypothetical protein